MKIDRRRVLALAGAGLGASACATTEVIPHDPDAIILDGVGFGSGVASGDPQRESIVLWTRATSNHGRVSLEWQVAETDDFGRLVARGRAETGAFRDYTVKAVATGLRPGRDYVYRFVEDRTRQASPIGRFRTLPDTADDVVLAVVSCALHPGGLFNAYDAIAKLPRVDAVVHLGDYIYEYGAGPADYGTAIGARLNRLPEPPHEIVTLADYRLRHAQYKSDPDLQAAHARAAWITVWDDHEVTNDAWIGGAENHDPDPQNGARGEGVGGEGDWATRKATALKAYYEWMPIREPARGRSAEMIDRSFRFADVATLHMVETRLTARDEQLSYERDLAATAAGPDLAGFRAKLNAPGRRLLGDSQLASLGRSVKASVDAGVAWQVLGNQVVTARVRGPDLVRAVGRAQVDALIAGLSSALQPRFRQLAALFVNDLPFNLDAWDGYPAERERLYGVLQAAGARSIVLAGDSHAFWVNDLRDAAGRRVAAEFGTTAVSSPSFGDVVKSVDLGALLAAQNEEVVFCDQAAKGFTLLRLTRAEVIGELTAVSTILAKPYAVRSLARFRVRPAARGVAGVERVQGPTISRLRAPSV